MKDTSPIPARYGKPTKSQRSILPHLLHDLPLPLVLYEFAEVPPPGSPSTRQCGRRSLCLLPAARLPPLHSSAVDLSLVVCYHSRGLSSIWEIVSLLFPNHLFFSPFSVGTVDWFLLFSSSPFSVQVSHGKQNFSFDWEIKHCRNWGTFCSWWSQQCRQVFFWWKILLPVFVLFIIIMYMYKRLRILVSIFSKNWRIAVPHIVYRIRIGVCASYSRTDL